MTFSIRGFLIGVLLSTFALLNFVAAVKGYEKGLETTRRVLDDELQDMAKLLAAHSTRVVRLGEVDQIHTAYQVIRDGRIQERSLNAPETLMAELTPGFAQANFLQQRWRIYSHYETESQIWVLVAEPESQRNRIAESVVLHTITPMLIAIPIAGLLIWLVIGVGLKPLNALSQQLKQKKNHSKRHKKNVDSLHVASSVLSKRTRTRSPPSCGEVSRVKCAPCCCVMCATIDNPNPAPGTCCWPG